MSRERDTVQTQVTISLEALLFFALALFSVFVRVVSLDLVPISEREVMPALSAWRAVMPSASASAFASDSAILFWMQSVSFTLMGGSELSARIMTALGGGLLTLMPFLFRDLLGKTRAFITALIWSLSPILLAASRFSSPVVWSMLFAIIVLWGVWRYWQTAQNGYATLATMAGAALIFLSEPGGPLLALILAASGFVALTLSSLDAPMDADLPPDDYLGSVRGRFAGWPISLSLLVSVVLVFAVATGFLLYPSGLNTVAETWRVFLSGFTEFQPGAPVFYPLTTALFYEPFMFVLAGIAVMVMFTVRQVSFVERFLIAWVVFGILAAMIYRGGTAAHALWIILPLSALIAHNVALALQDVSWSELWTANNVDEGTQRWAKFIVTLIAFVLFLVAELHFQVASRGFWIASEGSIGDYVARLNEDAFNIYTVGLIWFLIAILFIVVGYFLVTSLIGVLLSAHALLLGFFAFVLLTSFGSGWNLVGARSNDPAEVWFINGTTSEADLLRETLLELSFRETGGFPMIPIAVVGADDGVLAWELRDFTNTKYVDTVADARGEHIVIIPQSFDVTDPVSGVVDDPDLGASYVGQDFILTTTWRASWLMGLQVIPWWSDRIGNLTPKTLVAQPQPEDTVLVWVRQDIYDSTPYDPFAFEDFRE